MVTNCAAALVAPYTALSFFDAWLNRSSTSSRERCSNGVVLKALTVAMEARHGRQELWLLQSGCAPRKGAGSEGLGKTLDECEEGYGGKDDDGQCPGTCEVENQASDAGCNVLPEASDDAVHTSSVSLKMMGKYKKIGKQKCEMNLINLDMDWDHQCRGDLVRRQRIVWLLWHPSWYQTKLHREVTLP